MKKVMVLVLASIWLGLVSCSGQSAEIATPTAAEESQPALTVSTETEPVPTHTSPPTQTNTATPTKAPTATATPTLTPFPGFSENFKFYQAWVRDEKTYFYFMNANVTDTIYARIDDEFDIVCDPDPNYPQHLICTYERFISNRPTLKFDFFADESRTTAFYTGEYDTGLSQSLALFSNCESEYRIYDGKCYYAHTCYDEYGNVIYYADNIPYNGHFEGYSGPCQ